MSALNSVTCSVAGCSECEGRGRGRAPGYNQYTVDNSGVGQRGAGTWRPGDKVSTDISELFSLVPQID